MLKKIAIGLIAVIIVIGIGLGYVWNNLDSYIRAAVEKYGTAATRATVKLDSVKLSLTSGEGSLGGLTVGNPPGFASDKSVYLGLVSVTVNPNSIRGIGPIEIKDVEIEKPLVTYEMNNSGDSNLQTIARNAQSYAASQAGQKSAQTSPTGNQPGRKIIIDKLDIVGAQISVSQQMLKGKSMSASIPDIHMTDIGKSEGGATPAEVAQKILGTLTSAAGKVATGDLLKQLGSVTNIKGAVGDAISGAGTTPAGQAVDKLKGMLGQ